MIKIRRRLLYIISNYVRSWKIFVIKNFLQSSWRKCQNRLDLRISIKIINNYIPKVVSSKIASDLLAVHLTLQIFWSIWLANQKKRILLIDHQRMFQNICSIKRTVAVIFFAGAIVERSRSEWTGPMRNKSGDCSINHVENGTSIETHMHHLRDDRYTRERWIKCTRTMAARGGASGSTLTIITYSTKTWCVTPANSARRCSAASRTLDYREKCGFYGFYNFATCRRGGRREWAINETITRRSIPLARFSRN